MRFDSDIRVANPSKLYYGLKELATKADKQDNLLVQDFSVLETTDSDHITSVSLEEKEVKYEYLQKWIGQTLDQIASLDADKFSGGIAYMLLALVYRIDYLLSPEGKLLYDLEKIGGIYFRKDERPVIEKNRDMAEEFKKIKAKTKEEIFTYLFRSKYTFAIVAPQVYKTIADSIHGANQNLTWYRDNNYPFIATQIAEYGISYCQYSYSLPKVISEFFHLYMMVCYPDYFVSLGFQNPYHDPQTNQPNPVAISDRIKTIQADWREKFPHLDLRIQQLRFDSIPNFALTFTNELELLNTESK
jgi:hypothetical protein